MLLKGIEFMFVGMSVVFLFLALLVILVRLTSVCLKWYNRISMEQEEPVTTSIQRVMGKSDDIAVAIAAVKAFMKN